jgi:NhaA family Na+:H+ antiporter
MTVFFLLVGLEIEREIYIGELATLKDAMLPIIAAIGGMALPALIHLAFNYGTSTQGGFGIPMATDIAFTLGVLSLLGRSVPASLKVFLAALAIIDDLGAILIIAIFYSKNIIFLYLSGAGILFAIMIVLNRLKVYRIWFYLILGAFLWFCLYRGGIHPTVAGVLLAFAIPFGSGDEQSPSYFLQNRLHYIVAFGVLPLFALANTAIALPSSFGGVITSSNSTGIILGLTIGKPLGIFLFASAGITLGFCTLPQGLEKKHLWGAGMLAGIGFTMSIFITLLAFVDPSVVEISKIAVMFASFLAGLAGYMILRLTLRRMH